MPGPSLRSSDLVWCSGRRPRGLHSPARKSRRATPMNTPATASIVDCDHAPSVPTKAAEDVQLHQRETLDSHCSVGCGIRRAHAGRAW